MIPVIIESPFKGETKADESRNRAYLDKCIRWCILRGLTPYASHKMLVDALNDDNPAERSDGIEAGLNMASSLIAWSNGQVKPIFFEDYGVSSGMEKAKGWYDKNNYDYEFRKIGKL
jgi:hypothetical protein